MVFWNWGYFLRSLGHVASGGEKEEEHLWWAAVSGISQAVCLLKWWHGSAFGIPRGCLPINGRLSPHFAFFLLSFSSVWCFFFYLLCIFVFEWSFRVFYRQYLRRDGDCICGFQPYFSGLHSVRSLFLFSPYCVCFVVCWASYFATGCWYWFLGLFREVFDCFSRCV